MKPMKAGALRQIIQVQRYVETIDEETGYRTQAWVNHLDPLPAEWKAGPGREYLASESLRAEVQGRFIVRWSPDTAGIRYTDRVLWDGQVYELKSDPLVDPSARREVTLMVARGVTQDG